MADYWVSQTKKYCEFCRCWITDNKPSVDFHEKGRRHQENIKRKLRNITKQTAQAQRNLNRTDATIFQIESAALQAYKKDIEFNGDLSAPSIKKQLQSGGSIKKLWREALSKDGKSHYVNFMTKEVVWNPPRDGYVSLAEQRKEADTEVQQQLKAVNNFRRREAMMTMQKVQHEEMEEQSRKAREKMKEKRVVDDVPPVTYAPLIEPGRTDPYGKWQTVTEREIVNWELPTQEYVYQEPYIEYEPEPIVKEFVEKTVESMCSEGSSTFKKRKINSTVVRNTRQRLDDD